MLKDIALILAEISAGTSPSPGKRAYCRTAVQPALFRHFDIAARMPLAENPFGGRDRVPMSEARDFYLLQKERTRIGLQKIHDLLPPAVQQSCSVLSLNSYFKKGSRYPSIRGDIAATMWDVYASLPGWDEPVKPDEAYSLLAFDNPHQFFMNARLAHQQVMEVKAYTKTKRTEILDAMAELGLADGMLTNILHGGNHQSVTRLHVAYVMAYLSGHHDLPPFPERNDRLMNAKPAEDGIIPSP